jgi:hypothetical protein
MLATKGMALMVFTVLNVLGVGFLLYVFAQFWKEGHQSASTIRARRRMSGYGIRPKVVVVTLPITAEARRENGRVVRFPVLAGSDLPGRTRETSRSAAR